LLGSLFFLGAIAMTGMPPLSGFIGKLMILEATRSTPGWAWLWAILLATSLVMIAAFSRAGSVVFWRPAEMAAHEKPIATAPRAPIVAVASASGLLAATALLAVFAGPVAADLNKTAAQILDRAGYVRAVLGDDVAAKFASGPAGGRK
jgi:multicomponent K+:H+ antiporter subunit D